MKTSVLVIKVMNSINNAGQGFGIIVIVISTVIARDSKSH